jgi:hypothetical protein
MNGKTQTAIYTYFCSIAYRLLRNAPNVRVTIFLLLYKPSGIQRYVKSLLYTDT